MAVLSVAAPQESGSAKVLFGIDDTAGTNTARANALRSYQSALIGIDRVADLGVYPTSGVPRTGYMLTTSSTAIAISAASVPCQGVIVKADPDNVEDVWVGPAGITVNHTNATEGYRLEPGASVGIPCRNANTVFIRRGASTDVAVYWAASADF